MTTLASIALLLALGAAPDPQSTDAPAPADQPKTRHFTANPAPERIATGFLYKEIVVDNERYAYSVYVPPEYHPKQAWPVILFLHGSGERGSDGFLQTEVGIGRAIRRHRDWFPAIVVMPQCRPNKTWVAPDGLGDMSRMALKCVEAVSREYHCDHERLYLTGLSLGGQGTWAIAATLPGRFAAIVPVCGFIERGQSTGAAARAAKRLVNEKIWCFHGDADQAVSVNAAREIVDEIRKAGGKVHYTEYPNVGHNSWDPAYNDPKLWSWLFAQKRTAQPKPTAQPQEKPAPAD